VDTLYDVRFREVSGLSRFKNFKNQTTSCRDIVRCLVGYFILSHPVYHYQWLPNTEWSHSRRWAWRRL